MLNIILKEYKNIYVNLLKEPMRFSNSPSFGICYIYQKKTYVLDIFGNIVSGV